MGLLLMLALAGLFTGCGSVGVFHAVTPTVSGRVLAADTRQPLAGVQIIRVLPGQGVGGSRPAKGAELLQAGRPIYTDAAGNFVLAGKTNLTWWRPAGAGAVRLAWLAPGYVTGQTNLISPKTGASAAGAEISTGDILLKPVRVQAVK